jgi:hypothetical protein
MDLNARLDVFARLGEWLLQKKNSTTLAHWAAAARNENGWFTPDSVALALTTLARYYLHRDALRNWVARYPALSQHDGSGCSVGVIMAGNVPAVGFHDALSVLISGHRLLAKLSSQDAVLMRGLLTKLIELDPRLGERVVLAERLNEAEAIIATGSDNSARYFEHYFGRKPHIIRKNRTSVALLTGLEPNEELLRLGGDMLTYFGLGCRNVSKLYVPHDYDFAAFYEAIEPLGDVILHHKYRNNYDYNKSVMLVNGTPFLDNGFLLLTENPALVSPISVVHVERYVHLETAKTTLRSESERIQCVVTAGGWLPGSVAFGNTQAPALTDYADGVDTLAFLSALKKGG